MTVILRTWWPVFGALLLVQMGNGLTGSLVSIAGEARAFPPLLQGLVLSAFFVGSLAGALAAPGLIRRTSHGASAVVFTLALAVASLGFVFADEPWAWVVARLCTGAAITGMFATIESWLNLSIRDDIRGRVFSVYILIQLSGLAAGQALLSLRHVGEAHLFLFSAVVIGLAALAYRDGRMGNPRVETPKRLGVATLLARAPLGAMTIVLSGYCWAGIMASAPANLEKLGLDDVDKSLFMTLVVVSGMLAQFPAGWLADHMDRARVLFVLALAASLGAALPLLDGGRMGLLAFAVVFGAATFPFYAIGVARISEALAQDERTAASAWMVMLFDVGAILAPFALSGATAAWGSSAYFAMIGLPLLAFALAILATRRRA